MLIEERSGRAGGSGVNLLRTTVFLSVLFFVITIMTFGLFGGLKSASLLEGALWLFLGTVVRSFICGGCLWIFLQKHITFVALVNVALGVFIVNHCIQIVVTYLPLTF